MKATIMASREVKVFFKLIEKQYGAVPDGFKAFAFLKGKDKIHVVTKDVDKIDFTKLRINSMGLYIAEVKKEQIRLSIEGSQLIGPSAKKNVCTLTREQLKLWFTGNDVPVKEEYDGFVILKHGNDYVGSGKYKEGMIHNYVPKALRLIEMH